MSGLRAALIEKIWRGRDPFAEFPVDRFKADLQGWNSTHGYLGEGVAALRPSVVVEIGVWKGASVATVAHKMRELGLDGVVIAIDTWLGSSEMWTTGYRFDDLKLEHGYPGLQGVFMRNMIDQGVHDLVVPVPLDSINAAIVLRHFGVVPDMIHLDGAHDYESVSADLRLWWPMLRPGGLLIGDDYDFWPDVRRAFHDYFPGRSIENRHNKCRIWKDKAAIELPPPAAGIAV